MPIVEAIGVCVASMRPELKGRAARIQQAITEEIEKCCAEGLRVGADAAIIRERMMAARQRVLEEA